jgi:hypothetical protein
MVQSRLRSYKHSRAISISIAHSVIISKLYVSRNAVNWQASKTELVDARATRPFPFPRPQEKEGKGSAMPDYKNTIVASLASSSYKHGVPTYCYYGGIRRLQLILPEALFARLGLYKIVNLRRGNEFYNIRSRGCFIHRNAIISMA